MKIGNRLFDREGHVYICGILNVTPDSFSDGGTHNDVDQAIFFAKKLIDEGADLIDIGGESTRPGYTMISEQEEIERICPVIEGIKSRFDIPVSVDTYKAQVAESGIDAGADMINDIWGLQRESQQMVQVVAKKKVPICLMHNKKQPFYGDFMKDICSELMESVQIAFQHGISKENIILDPGVGFAKSYEENLLVMKHMDQIVKLGYPVLLGASRKSVVGLTLDLPVGQREEGTLALSVLAAMKGCSFVRVHDVQTNRRALDMIEAVLNA